ncbi:hypothetical protein Patl1_05547 [Pistacia atlantica]|uniref:Uncharacterized protein n=1 Tax=Pistacia atlantica TaxID=434234 RepID=A0ACC1BP94_9ROSI|nr:hypothetical protein Patl1_05547 [Pistacia atlantica]
MGDDSLQRLTWKWDMVHGGRKHYSLGLRNNMRFVMANRDT